MIPLNAHTGGKIALYGLPSDRPEDRHKWFFSLTEAKTFVTAMAQRYGLRIAEIRVAEKPRPAVVRAVRRMRYLVHEHYLNRYAHTLCTVFVKGEG